MTYRAPSSYASHPSFYGPASQLSSKALLVLTTCTSAEEADGIAANLVEARLAACVNRLDGITSTYRWEGELRRDQETLLLIKTTEDRFEALEQAICKQHSYELPEVLAVPVQGGSSGFLDWLVAAVREA